MNSRSWDYMDRNVPSSPWGRVQEATTICRGVRMVETAGHGGLMIAPGAAKKYLSLKAREVAERYSSYYCFEEDCLCNVVFLERPEWLEALLPNCEVSREELTESVRRWVPLYFSE